MSIADARKGLRHLFVHDLVLATRIGVDPHEQQADQRVRLSLDLGVADSGQAPATLAEVVDYAALTGRVRRLLGAGHVDLVEQLAERIAALFLEDPRVRAVRPVSSGVQSGGIAPAGVSQRSVLASKPPSCPNTLVRPQCGPSSRSPSLPKPKVGSRKAAQSCMTSCPNGGNDPGARLIASTALSLSAL
jgi:dihydroneopterin aldolase